MIAKIVGQTIALLSVFVSVMVLSSAAPLSGRNESNAQSAVQMSGQTSGHSSGQLSWSSKERNWLLTKAWLIDNINRLRHELNELSRDYTHHIESSNVVNEDREQLLVHDVATLRADHTVLSQQQKQIIALIQKKHNNEPNEAIPVIPQLSNTTKKRHKKRHSNFQHFRQSEQLFESQTKRNISEIFAEMSALHDITVTLFRDIQSLEKKINNSE